MISRKDTYLRLIRLYLRLVQAGRLKEAKRGAIEDELTALGELAGMSFSEAKNKAQASNDGDFTARYPKAAGDPSTMDKADFIPLSVYNNVLRATYFKGATQSEKVASSRTTPQKPLMLAVGAWRIDNTFNGKYGYEIAQLQRLSLDVLNTTELDAAGEIDPVKRADVERYTGWLSSSEPPPIEVLQTDKGTLKITDGHRRFVSHRNAGRDSILAWVSPTVKTDDGFGAGYTLEFAKKGVKPLTVVKPSAPKVEAPKVEGVTVEAYTEKSIVVRGNTKPLKDALKAIGGRWNRRLRGGPGWIFRASDRAKVAALLSEAPSRKDVHTPHTQQQRVTLIPDANQDVRAPFDRRRVAVRLTNLPEWARGIERSEALSSKSAARAMRADLRKAFPGVKFSVRIGSGTGRGFIHMEWTDGPSEATVARVVGFYNGRSTLNIDDSTDALYAPVEDKKGRIVKLHRTHVDGIHYQRKYSPGYLTAIRDTLNYTDPPEVEDSKWGARFVGDDNDLLYHYRAAARNHSTAYYGSRRQQRQRGEVEQAAKGKPNPERGARLRDLADRLEPRIEAKLHPSISEQRTTSRRARIARGMREKGLKMRAAQSGLRALADRHETGDVPQLLYGVKTIKAALYLSGAVWEAGNPLRTSGIEKDQIEDAKAAFAALTQPMSEEEKRAYALQDRLATLIDKKIPGFFPTPDAVAGKLVALCPLRDGLRVLEPSAGIGSVADAIRAKNPNVNLTLIEIDHTLVEILKMKGYAPIPGDFLSFNPTETTFDVVLMNPPFENGQDIEHVRHAYNMLSVGGCLGAIMGEGAFFRQDKKARAFREWFETVAGVSTKLPEGSFQSSLKSTGVSARLVVIQRETPVALPEKPVRRSPAFKAHKKAIPTVIELRAPVLIQTRENRRSSGDGRRRVDRHVYEYTGSDGKPYRKSFETARGQRPTVPRRGTHEEINAVEDQIVATQKDVPKRLPVKTEIDIYEAHHGQQDGKILATTQDGELAGRMDFVLFRGLPYVSMITVDDAFRRRGVATQLFEALTAEYDSVVEVGGGFSTDDGRALWEALEKRGIVKMADRPAPAPADVDTDVMEAAYERLAAAPGDADAEAHYNALVEYQDAVDAYKHRVNTWTPGDELPVRPPVDPPPTPAVRGVVEDKTLVPSTADPAPGGPSLSQSQSYRVYDVPLAGIETDPARFQPRGAAYSEESAQRVAANEHPELMEPVWLWRDQDDRIFMLAGHSRLEGFRRRGETTIPGQFFDGDENAAKAFAWTENDKGTSLSNAERARYLANYKKCCVLTKKDLQNEAQRLYDKNARTVLALAHLKQTGTALATLKAFGGNSTGEARDAETMAVWVGKIRMQTPALTDSHEEEIFSFLMKNYKTQGRRFSSYGDFSAFVGEVVERRTAFGVLDERLNFANIRPESRSESIINEQLRALEKASKQARSRRDNKFRELIERQELGSITQADIERVMKPFYDDVAIAERDELRARNEAVQARQHLANTELTLFGENPSATSRIAQRFHDDAPRDPFVYMGDIDMFFGDNTMLADAGRWGWRIFSGASMDYLLILPREKVRVLAEAVENEAAEAAFRQFHGHLPEERAFGLRIPNEPARHVGYATFIKYRTTFGAEGETYERYHWFDENKRPLFKMGDAYLIERLDITEDGILN